MTCERAGGEDVGGVGVEHAGVVRLAVPGEDLRNGRVQGVAVGGEALLDHPQAAVGHDRAAQRRVGLQPDDQLVLLVDVTGSVARDRCGRAGVGVVDAARPLLGEQRGQPRPQRAGAVGRAGQERCVTGVGGHVGLDEVPDVDPVCPWPVSEALPRVGVNVAGLGPGRLHGRAHDDSSSHRSHGAPHLFVLDSSIYVRPAKTQEALVTMGRSTRPLSRENAFRPGPSAGPLRPLRAVCRTLPASSAGPSAGPFRRRPPGRPPDPSGVVRRAVRVRPVRARARRRRRCRAGRTLPNPVQLGDAGVEAGTLAIPFAIRNVVIRGAA